MKTLIKPILFTLAGITWNLKSRKIGTFPRNRDSALLTLLTLLTFNCFAQQPTPTKLNYALAKKLYEFGVKSSEFGVRKTEEAIAVLVKGDTSEIRKQMQLLGGTFRYVAGNIASIQLPLSKVNDLANNNLIQRIEYNDAPPQPLNDQMLINSNAASVHAGIAPLPKGYDGTGVVVGIIDDGIDYTHPDFKDANGKTRIKYLWDRSAYSGGGTTQKIYSGGSTPKQFNYGQEWDSSQIDNGLAPIVYCNSPVCEGGHGTLSASIAAGNGLAVNNYRGAAPNADLVIVSRVDTLVGPAILDATAYIYEKAAAMGKPCVINISYTSGYMGSHDGKNLEAEAMDNLITQRNGQVLVAAAGNAGEVPFHLSYTVTQDTSFTWLLYNSRWKAAWCQIWMDTSSAKNIEFAVGADKVSPDYSYRGRIPFLKALNSLGVIRTDTLFNSNGNRIAIIQSYSEFINKSYTMEFYIVPDSTQYNFRLITKGSGEFDAWSLDQKNMTAQFADKNLPDSTKFPDIVHYKLPDNEQTIANSFQCSPHVITVGNYMNRNYYTDVNGNIQSDTSVMKGDIYCCKYALSSSRGPTRDGRIKPEITASGQITFASIVVSSKTTLVTNYPTYIGLGGMHRIANATSAAAPVVAGAVALYLQQNPDASNEKVRNAVMNCAKTDSFTGKNLPNSIWGYGKIDAFKMLTQCSGLGIEDANKKDDITLMNYPNPFTQQTTIFYEISSISLQGRNPYLIIHDVLGREVLKYEINPEYSDLKSEIIIDRGTLPSGVYFYNISLHGKSSKTQKLIIL